MHDSVADSANLGQILDNAILRICQCFQYQRNALLMIRLVDLCDLLLAASLLVREHAVNADTLAKAFCQNRFGIGIDQLILQ